MSNVASCAVSLVENSKRLASRLAVNETFGIPSFGSLPCTPPLSLQNQIVIGIGSGSTVVFVIERLAELNRFWKLNLLCVPTSFQSRILCQEAGLTVVSFT